jgi:predicted outer membrane protein
MRKMILTAAALAILSSTAFAQSSDKAGGSTAPAAQQSGDNMAKGDMSKDKTSKKKMAKSSKKTGNDTK